MERSNLPDRDRLHLGGNAHRTPTPHEFRAFLTLAEVLHFGRSARRLGIAQPSLSEAIRRLEAKLDLVLFDRSSRWVALTREGRSLLPIAQEVIDALAAAEAISGRPAEPIPGTFTIGIELPGLLELTGPVLARFRERHPGTRLAVREFNCAHGFTEKQLDAALSRSPILDERLVVHPVATQPRVFVLPPGHRASDAKAATLLDFQDDPFVAPEERAPAAREYWLAREQRDDELPAIGAEAFTAAEWCCAVRYLDVIGIGVEDRGHQPAPPFTVVDALDLPDNVIGVVVRADDRRPIVQDFVDLVPRLIAEYADLAPCISPLAPATGGVVVPASS